MTKIAVLLSIRIHSSMRPESGVAAYDVEDVTLIDSTAISSAVDVDGVKEHDEQREESTMGVTHIVLLKSRIHIMVQRVAAKLS
jgi:hypothetical protein